MKEFLYIREPIQKIALSTRGKVSQHPSSEHIILSALDSFSILVKGIIFYFWFVIPWYRKKFRTFVAIQNYREKKMPGYEFWNIPQLEKCFFHQKVEQQ